MKFPVKICPGCGLDLTDKKPAEIKNPGDVALVGTCPKCSAPYFMADDSALLSDAPEAEPEPEAEKPKKGKGKTEPKPEAETEPEPELETGPETPPEE